MPVIDESWYRKPEDVPESVSAGGVVARVEDGRILIALARERDYRENVLPKGHVEPGEETEAAARREIAEEVGVADLTLLTSLGKKGRLDFRKTEWKTTHYFLYRTDQVDATPTHTEQHTQMIWAPLEPTPEFFWPEQRAIVEDNRDRIVALMQGVAVD